MGGRVGYLGARQTERLLDVVEELQKSGARVKLHLLGDSKQMQGIQAGNLLAPLRELGEKREVDYAHLTEILGQRDPGLLEIARGLNREDRPFAVNARETLGVLAKRHEMIEIADPQDLRKAVVEHYLEESRKPSQRHEHDAAGERELDGKGHALVDLGDRKVGIDLTRYRHLDHGYAVTVHKSQGSTVEHSILYAPVPAPK